MNLQTEFEFTLPRGYIDRDGNLHRSGTMRLANAKDEILPLQDPRVQRNEAYLIVILLSRVITRLGDVADINPGVVENFFASDLAYLQDFYNAINDTGKPPAERDSDQERVQEDAGPFEERWLPATPDPVLLFTVHPLHAAEAAYLERCPDETAYRSFLQQEVDWEDPRRPPVPIPKA